MNLDLNLKNVNNIWGAYSSRGGQKVTTFESPYGVSLLLSITDSLNWTCDECLLLKSKLLKFLKTNDFVINYFITKPPDVNDYPDDFDDISLAIRAVSDVINNIPTNIIFLLTQHITDNPVPYGTWVGIDSANNSTDLVVNINIFRMLIRFNIISTPLFNWIIERLNMSSIYYPDPIKLFMITLFFIDTIQFTTFDIPSRMINDLKFKLNMYKNKSIWSLLALNLLGASFEYNDHLSTAICYGLDDTLDHFVILDGALEQLFDISKKFKFRDGNTVLPVKDFFTEDVIKSFKEDIVPFNLDSHIVNKFLSLKITSEVINLPRYVSEILNCNMDLQIKKLAVKSLWLWFCFWAYDLYIDKNITLPKNFLIVVKKNVQDALPNYENLKRDTEKSVTYRLSPFYLKVEDFFTSNCVHKNKNIRVIFDSIKKYLLIRQINDDLHDFWIDLEEGKNTLATILYYKLKNKDVNQEDYVWIVNNVFDKLFNRMQGLLLEISSKLDGFVDLAIYFKMYEDWQIFKKELLD